MDEIDQVLNESYDELRLILVSSVLPAMGTQYGTNPEFFLSTLQMDAEDLLNDACVKFITTVDRTVEYRDTKKFVISSVMNIAKQLCINNVNRAKQRYKHKEDVKEAFKQQFCNHVDEIEELEFEDAINELDDVSRTIARNIEEPNSKFKTVYGVHYRNVKAEYEKTARELQRLGFEV